MHLFYTPNITANDTHFILNENESKHAVRVLRLTENDNITLIDGKGTFYEAQISEAHPKKCKLVVLSKKTTPNNLVDLHIAIAPTKNNDRLEWFTEKCTEIGIQEITPILCQHSERKVLKDERLIKTAIAAMKQSLKATLPIINGLTPINKLIIAPFNGKKYIAHCYQENQKHLKNILPKGEKALILIGPEGDFSKGEINLALKNDFEPISLGNSRLRTETAGVVACHTFNLMNE